MAEPDDDRTVPLDASQLLRRAQQTAKPVAAILTCLGGSQRGKAHVLRHGRNLIGRSEAASIRLNTPAVSRRHAEIVEHEGTYTLTDLGSSNGTICRGRFVRDSVALAEGDRIVLGDELVFRFSFVDALEEEVTAELFEQATRDPLTSARNRRYLDHRLDSEWPWSRRHHRPCAVVMLDLDHFKQVNDRYGHAAGDHVLREFVRIVESQIRQEDLLARVGGEEFIILCRDTAASGATVLAERIRDTVQNHAFAWEGERLTVTFSAGVATSLETGLANGDDLVALADRRLYEAKAQGRNRTVAPKPDGESG